ncbi:hypothetical protein RE628_16475 [Paenibacillus sp. D2_2]|uniref:hypothetical protein n=1 Tax=Paenibacillus sp. D2_2 TaxID=3073092 RepID=UPI002814F6CA|nr:hypothetical protein [Paenibacillus sp. D2_2]WMT39099.1 hypothetical protein RE628_16475 [Paenibacillus sp. D2_2]
MSHANIINRRLAFDKKGVTPMRCLAWGLNALLAALLLSGCGSGTQQIVKQELDRYNMKSYQEGSDRQLVRGTTLNGSLLNSLQAECANRGIRLTHETYAETLDGGISYNYFINGDARHFLILNVYPSEQERLVKFLKYMVLVRQRMKLTLSRRKAR